MHARSHTAVSRPWWTAAELRVFCHARVFSRARAARLHQRVVFVLGGVGHAGLHRSKVQAGGLGLLLGAPAVVEAAIGHGAVRGVVRRERPPQPGLLLVHCLLEDAQLPLVLLHHLRPVTQRWHLALQLPCDLGCSPPPPARKRFTLSQHLAQQLPCDARGCVSLRVTRCCTGCRSTAVVWRRRIRETIWEWAVRHQRMKAVNFAGRTTG